MFYPKSNFKIVKKHLKNIKKYSRNLINKKKFSVENIVNSFITLFTKFETRNVCIKKLFMYTMGVLKSILVGCQKL